MPFKAGNTYGKGRPKGSGKIQILKDYSEKYGFKKLISIAEGSGHGYYEHNGRLIEHGPNASIQFEALKLILAYGCGKPTEYHDFTTGGETLSDWAVRYFGADGQSGSRADSDRKLRRVSKDNSK
jgi:hypothetical protein